MTDSSFNLLQLERCPNWYEHLSRAEAAMAAQDRTDSARDAAGWTVDEGGWYAPDGTHEYDWSGVFTEDVTPA